MKTTGLTMLIGMIISLGLTASAFAAQKYTLKGDTPTGTRLQQIDAIAKLPFDKKYFQLTAPQREAYRARFIGIAKDQVPPFPRNGLQDIYRPLIDANHSGASGQLRINVVVNEQGEVEEMEVLNAPNARIAEASKAAIRKTVFDPAYCAGAPCKMMVPVQIKYL